MSGSINYLRYGSRYFEKMRKLFHEHPEVHKILKRKICSKTNARYFKAVAVDLKLEFSAQKEALEELEDKRSIRHMPLYGN